jgi:hypothetical protein
MRNSCGGSVDGRLPSSTRPGCVRQVSGVLVEVGAGEGVSVAVGMGGAVGDMDVWVGAGGFSGEQAERAARKVNSVAICFMA